MTTDQRIELAPATLPFGGAALMSPIHLLYYLGAGPSTPERVDVASLFGTRLSKMGLQITWYFKVASSGGPITRGQYQGSPARVCGCSRWPGLAGRVASKLYEMVAALHFFGHACTARYDIIQVRDDFVAGALGLLAAKLRRRRFVFWLSYPFPEARLGDAREGRARSRTYSKVAGHLSAWLLYKVILPNVDHAFVQSEQMKRDLLRPGIVADRLTPVPMGVPDEDFPEVMAPSNETLVLYLGTLARVRRLDMVIRAFARVHQRRPDARLAIVGDGDVPEDRASLVEEVRRHHLEGAVIFTGQIPRDQALHWVRRAAVCLSPFYPTFVLRSTSPTKLIEYMALGRAVVANDHPEQAEVLRASHAGICTSWDEREFAEGILSLLSDPERCRRAGEDGRRWVATHRTYNLIAIKVLARYRALCFSAQEVAAQ